MRKPLLPASKRPAQEVRQTRSVSANELKKKVKGNKKQTTGKSNDSAGSKTQSKDSNMTTKPKVAKKPSNTGQNAGNAKPKTLIKEKPKLAKKFVKKPSLIAKKQTLDKIEKKKKAIGKKQANSTPSTSSNQQPETPAQSQQAREAEEAENGETSSEPVEVVIHVKKPQNKTGPKKVKKTGPSSGKIGKRKISKQPEPAKSLIKNIGGTSGKLETVVSTILEVAVLTKKITPPKTKPSTSKTIATKKPIKNKLQNKLEIKNVVEQNEKDSCQGKGKDSKEVKEKETKKDVEKKSGKDVKKESKLEKKDTKEEPVDAKEEKMKEAKKDPKSLKEDTIDNVKKKLKILKPKKSESKEIKKEVEIVKADSVNVAEVTKQISKKKKCNEKIIKKNIKHKIKMSKPDDTKSSKKCAEEGKVSPAPEKLVRKERSKSPTKSKKECNKRNIFKGKTVEKVEEKKVEIIPVAETNIKGEESDDDLKTRRLKLFGFWEGPRRHREASLNALAKVHCLYENESRGAMMEMFDKSKQRVDKKKTEKPKEQNLNEAVIKAEPETSDDKSVKSDFSLMKEENTVTRRTLRTTPGMRSVGRHYDVETSSSSQPSSGDESDVSEKKTKGKQRHSSPPPLPSPSAVKEKEVKEKFDVQSDDENKKKKEEPVKKVRKRRKRCELMMDLKDMVVRKRMASLNASAMLAATYSMEKRSVRGDGDLRKRGMRNSSDDSTSTDMDVETSDDEMIVSGSSKKVAVIVNQDTDVTITGLYVNSTTRSTRHCSITGMQYRISSTSHTQTESTAVTTETVIHTTDHVSVSHSQSGSSVEAVGSPGGSCKSYTPLGALSSMQPPGNNSNALMRRHPCSSSAFSAPYHPHQEIHGKLIMFIRRSILFPVRKCILFE
ncbi:muscle M-line assembly protein unc-89-like isoform X2 [Cimex lectularius]|uniref:Uncharacterized protein n=1 Tax=Cimex lectularius TaxID=79782 RepID=A0A8I6TMS0_CIMLE|nr:muscle M-line assembly protein unc-89-like isoform X2 [Cimex lectularius]